MKKIKLRTKEFELISGIGELRYDKMVMFNQYIIAVFQGIDTPLFASTMDKVKHHFDKGEFMQGYNELVNYDTAIKFKEYQLDPLGMCFAILMKGDETDEDILKVNLRELIDDGLTWDMVKEEVVNFMALYPDKFSPYLQAWKMMGAGIEL
jgi:hypothetical protein